MGLRQALTANLPLKLTSLFLSVFLWFMAAGEEPASALLPVDLSVRPPPGRSVVQQPGALRALVVGPRRELLKLSAAPLRLTRILPDSTEGDDVRLDVGPGDIELPRGVQVHVQDVQPRGLEIGLDSTFQRLVPVEAVVRLQAEAGHALGTIAVLPGTVRLFGPRDLIERIDSVRTLPLEVSRADGPLEQTLPLDTTAFGRVRVTPATVMVRVEVEEVGERTLTDVPVRLPSELAATARPARASVEVQVRGAVSRLRALRRDSVTVLVDWSGGNVPGRVRLRVLPPVGLKAVAMPDSLDLVRRSTDG